MRGFIVVALSVAVLFLAGIELAEANLHTVPGAKMALGSDGSSLPPGDDHFYTLGAGEMPGVPAGSVFFAARVCCDPCEDCAVDGIPAIQFRLWGVVYVGTTAVQGFSSP